MSQGDLGTLVAAETSGTDLASRLRTWRDAMHTTHSGATRPSYVQPGMLWIDTSGAAPVLKLNRGETDDIVPLSSSLGAVANAMLANMAQGTVKGRRPGTGDGVPVDITIAQQLVDFGFVNLLSSTGYQRLPGGALIQWGDTPVGDGTVTFPLAFSAVPKMAITSLVGIGDSNNAFASHISALNQGGFTVRNRRIQVSSIIVSPGSATWIAAGY